jgi:hypothetical protein
MRADMDVSSLEFQKKIEAGGWDLERDLRATKWHALDNLSKTRLKDYSSLET